ncbi:MAG: hypothetical protein DHS20C01_35330 [marine bacterium B5-7]|nr:MAG: hypothetical protein DHS20C01_35330 [marine bacterium B5-7]
MHDTDPDWFRSRIDTAIAPAPVVFHPCHKHRFLFLSISKNACTSIKHAILSEEQSDLEVDVQYVHQRLGFRHNGKTCLSPYAVCTNTYKGYTRFAVWRDPLDRLKSLVSWLNGEGRSRLRWLNIRKDLETMDATSLLDLVRAEFGTPDIDSIDEHIRLQFHTLQAAPELDYLVPIEHIDDFMDEKFGIQLTRLNRSDNHKETTVGSHFQSPATQLTYIDSKIPDWHANRFYRLPTAWVRDDFARSNSVMASTCVVWVVHTNAQLKAVVASGLVNITSKIVIVDVSEDGTLPVESVDYPDAVVVETLTARDDFTKAIRAAFELAWQHAPYVLLVYGDETISTGYPGNEHLEDLVYAVDISVPDGSSRSVPRMFRRNSTLPILRAGIAYPGIVVCERFPGITLAKSASLAPDLGIARKDVDDILANTGISEGDRNVLLGDLYALLGRHDEAIKAYSLCQLESMPAQVASYILYQKANQWLAAGKDAASALKIYNEAWEISPQKAEPLYQIATLLRRAGEVTSALAAARKATNMPLLDTSVYYDRTIYEYRSRIEYGYCAKLLGDAETAVQELSIARRDGLPQQTKQWIDDNISSARREFEQAQLELIPTATAAAGRKKLTIGMATFDDYDGVYFSVMAIRLFHPEITEETEIVVIDNNPYGTSAKALRALANRVSGYRYIPLSGINSTAVRDAVFVESNADYVLCIDCHVMLEAGSIRKLIDYLDDNPDCNDLLQGPLVNDTLKSVSTHFLPHWQSGMYGFWGCDERGSDSGNDPFEIPMQGLGLFACRRSAWLGFNSKFRGFGGEEGYIHEKFRRAGRHTLCLPFLRWIHRFDRPSGTPYMPRWFDRYRNYMIGFEEVGLDTTEVDRHFSELLGESEIRSMRKQLKNEQESPFYFFDAIFCINLDREEKRWELMQRQFEALGIENQVSRFSAIESTSNHHIGCALSHRMIIEQARRRGLRNILVFEDDAILHRDTAGILDKALEELARLDWSLLYLGGHKWDKSFALSEGCRFLEQPHGMTMTHAIAYNAKIFNRILDDLPNSIDGMERWLQTHHGIDQYLRYIGHKFVTRPTLASQPGLHQTQDRWPILL